jgi:beta-galactosidase/beta-glucuronidase
LAQAKAATLTLFLPTFSYDEKLSTLSFQLAVALFASWADAALAAPMQRELNERGLQWIDKEDWIYQTTFSVSREELEKTSNLFREWAVDVKGKVKQDNNLLYIYFHSPIKVDMPKFDALPYQYRTASANF